jgi:hypothetical protein
MPELLDKAKEIVPSSYYDLIARVVPGCVAIVAFAWIFPDMAILVDSATDLLLLIGAGYIVGVWLSSISTLLLLPLMWIPPWYTYSDRAIWAGIRQRAPHVDGSTVRKMAAESTAAENMCVVALLLNIAIPADASSFKLRVLVAALPLVVLIAIVRRYMLRVRIDEPVGEAPLQDTPLTPDVLRKVLLTDAVLVKASGEAKRFTKKKVTVEELRKAFAWALANDDERLEAARHP